nr:MAG TPA: hypothetical protein [Caudoviricetes sp.]
MQNNRGSRRKQSLRILINQLKCWFLGLLFSILKKIKTVISH